MELSVKRILSLVVLAFLVEGEFSVSVFPESLGVSEGDPVQGGEYHQ